MEVVYNSYDALMAHVNKLAQEHGQKGPVPMVMAWKCKGW